MMYIIRRFIQINVPSVVNFDKLKTYSNYTIFKSREMGFFQFIYFKISSLFANKTLSGYRFLSNIMLGVATLQLHALNLHFKPSNFTRAINSTKEYCNFRSIDNCSETFV